MQRMASPRLHRGHPTAYAWSAAREAWADPLVHTDPVNTGLIHTHLENTK